MKLKAANQLIRIQSHIGSLYAINSEGEVSHVNQR
jgi:hypothetical protein